MCPPAQLPARTLLALAVLIDCLLFLARCGWSCLNLHSLIGHLPSAVITGCVVAALLLLHDATDRP